MLSWKALRGKDQVIELSPEVVVLGGGLAGSSAAILLARAGRNVSLIEKEAKPQHKVCGEFLSIEALTYLRNLGVNVSALGAVPIRSVRLAGRLGISETQLPFEAMSLTRRMLDEELLRLAAEAGVRVLRGCQVLNLEKEQSQWNVTLQNNSVITSPVTFLATGKHELRGQPPRCGVHADLIAFKMYWKLTSSQMEELSDHVELNLYHGGYAGLQPVEDGVVNLCCLVSRSHFQRLGSRWEILLHAMQAESPLLKRRLSDAEPLLLRPLAISSIPYGFVRQHSAGLWALGDQAAVIPSFTGDGMSIALHSGRLAAEMYLRGETAKDFQQKLHDDLRKQVSFATILSRGLVREPQKTLLESAVRLWPYLLKVVANRTRISVRSAL
jgi:flavin-dependent dehydrogenase